MISWKMIKCDSTIFTYHKYRQFISLYFIEEKHQAQNVCSYLRIEFSLNIM